MPTPATSPAFRRRFHLICLVATAVIGSAAIAGRLAASELRRTPVVRAVELTIPSVVNIHGRKTVPAAAGDGLADGGQRVNGMGTGVFIDHRGYILTNYHVVDGVSRIQVTLYDGKNRLATLVGGNPDTDLAIIKITGDEPYPVVTVGTSDDLMLGEPVVAIGNAFGYPHTITRGIISALHRTVEVSETQKYEDLIQTDASINPGNSGGPLVNADSEMIGLNAAVRIGAQGIGFAIPIDNALAMAAELLTVENVDGQWHGITGRRQPGVPGGSGPQFVVDSVAQGSPAEKAGIQAGDVVTQIDDSKIERAIDIERALIGRSTSEEVSLTVSREGEARQLGLVMARRSGGSAGDVAEQSWTLLGLRLQPIPADEFRNRSSRYRGGLRVLAVRENSPAERQGIRPGDVLVGMHIWETISLENVAYVLRHADSEQVKFYILRGNDTLYGHLPMTLQAQVIDATMEADLIRWLRHHLPPHPLLQVGPGDDAAVLRLSTEAQTVVTTDLLTDGVDFHLGEIDARRAGWKALAVNLSDLAAMAARPVAAVVSLALPRTGGGGLARQLFEGILPLAERYEVALAGGDTNAWDGPLVICITALGSTTGRGPLLRSGAKPGDEIVVSGQFGGSILAKHLDFEPRVTEAILLHERYRLHAGIDVSDGLSLDLAHLAEESRCGVEIDVDEVPVSAAARQLAAADANGPTALDHALGDGEDFELIIALPPEESRRLVREQPLGVPVTRIGRCLEEPGLWQRDRAGRRSPLPISGWQHEFDD